MPARRGGGFGGALVGPAMWAYLAETATPCERGRAIARGTAAYAGGQIIGVPLETFLAAGALMATRFGFSTDPPSAVVQLTQSSYWRSLPTVLESASTRLAERR
ncbi:hypothetical protein [Rhodococcus artemisiae]|uniref:Uncharacterized protein n=1 Tax=Rhodococcus artemisiae TaxID=714159 RepID=A0ABU7LB89_9NOCA|nr:hypothetical protein [Rhodococcus artemisiae]MEE2058815.1 hypothetical protein [Rhodococcus artemisiae]